MKWTHKKPTVEGTYWVGWDYDDSFGAEIKHCGVEDNDNPCLSWIPEWDEGWDWHPVDDDSPRTWYYGPIIHPKEP